MYPILICTSEKFWSFSIFLLLFLYKIRVLSILLRMCIFLFYVLHSTCNTNNLIQIFTPYLVFNGFWISFLIFSLIFFQLVQQHNSRVITVLKKRLFNSPIEKIWVVVDCTEDNILNGLPYLEGSLWFCPCPFLQL